MRGWEEITCPCHPPMILYKVMLGCKLTGRGCFLEAGFHKAETVHRTVTSCKESVGPRRGEQTRTGAGGEGSGNHLPFRPGLTLAAKCLLYSSPTELPPLFLPSPPHSKCSVCKPLCRGLGRAAFASVVPDALECLPPTRSGRD